MVFKNIDVKKVFMCSRQYLCDGVFTAPISGLERTKILMSYCPDTTKIFLLLQISAGVSLAPLSAQP